MNEVSPSSRPGLGARAPVAAWGLAWTLLAAAPAAAALTPGDLNGDGAVDSIDEGLLADLHGSEIGDSAYDPAGDLNSDGRIDVLDVALLGANFGASGGETDGDPPGLLTTLNDIPDDMNDLLVVPPSGFQITLHFDTSGGSALDTGSLSVVDSEDFGPIAAGLDFGVLFTVTPTRAVLEVPFGVELTRTSHYLTVSIRDLAGNEVQEVYGFAVRDFTFGQPLANLQTIFLDFDQDRSLGPELDFLEDLREYGLSSDQSPQGQTLEPVMRNRLVAEILARVHPYYGRNPDSSPGPDAANVVFVATQPAGTHSRMCVGGESSSGPAFLGAATLDMHNAVEDSDECSIASQFGIFPQALDNLWGGNAEFQAAFFPVDSDSGGTPAGEDPLDPIVLSPAFDPQTATSAELARHQVIENAVSAFAQAIASAIAHETGHMLGLTAPGPAPAGLWGGMSGGDADHNVAVGGGTPPGNFLMNQGGSFTFEEITGRSGQPLPSFRPLSWAYLRDRVALNSQVTALLPAPSLAGADPGSPGNPVVFSPIEQNVLVTFTGDNLQPGSTIELIRSGDPTPDPVFAVTFVDPQTLTGIVNEFFTASPAVYDVHLVNVDGQEFTLPAGLHVQ